MAENRVSVAVRVRPVLREGRSQIHQQEKFELIAAHRMGDNAIQLREQRQDEAGRSSVFTFDHIFDTDSTQSEVYEDAVVDLIDGALSTGVNATLLAYGQTGSGKTHTILGDVKANPLENDLLTAQSGMFLRVLSDLLDYGDKRKKDVHVVIGLSCVEVYNEKIRDLFGESTGSSSDPPEVKAVMIGDEVFMPDVKTKEVSSMNSVFNEIQLATSRRRSRATDNNASSSRSHCLFMIDILQRPATASRPELSLVHQEPKASRPRSETSKKRNAATPTPSGSGNGNIFEGFLGQVLKVPGEEGEPPVCCSKVLLADLAGSEKIQKSGVTGEGLAEATSINMSLTSLGNVVHALHQGKIPSYRDSKLTRLLKPAFNQPQSKVLLLAQLSPTQLTFDESIGTMHFANKVKAMKVQTSHGDDGDTTGIEYLETEKILEEILADCRIFACEHEGVAPALLRRNRISVPTQTISPGKGNTGVYGPYRDMRNSSRKDRLSVLSSTSAIEKAQSEKDRAEQECQERERREEEEKPKKIAEKKEKIYKEYKQRRDEAEDDYAHEIKSFLNQAMQNVTIESSFQMQTVKAEEDEAWEQLIAPAGEQQKLVLESMLRRDKAEFQQLADQLATMKKSAMVVEGAEEQRELDEHYANSIYCHCNAKRVRDQVKYHRDVQLAVFHAMRGNDKVARWVYMQRQRDEQEKHKKEAGGASSTTTTNGGSKQQHVDPNKR